MSAIIDRPRHLAVEPAAHLRRPKARLQPIQAREGTPTVDVDRMAAAVADVAVIEPVVTVRSPEHWAQIVGGLGPEIDAILPISIPAYPTEVWNSNPEPLMDRGLPVVFWPLMDYDEPDFWRWSARDFLRALGVEVHIVRDHVHGVNVLKALAVKRMLARSSMVVIGKQNFPWNARAAGYLMTRGLGTRIVVRPLEDIRELYADVTEQEIDDLWSARKDRYQTATVVPDELRQALRGTVAIRRILEEEQAIGFGVNCFGDLIIGGGRDTPCLAQVLLREEGYIASCDGDYVCMMSMALATHMLDKQCVMSNMYPVQYVGALTDHFGDPLSPDPTVYPREEWPNLARLGHCGFVGVVSPEMSPSCCVALHDWGGTYEIKRDGSGCGIDGDLAPGTPITVVELCFDGRTLLLAEAEVCETTRHEGMPHCESTALLRFRDLPGFVENISREHTAIVYGSHVEDLTVLGSELGLNIKTF